MPKTPKKNNNTDEELAEGVERMSVSPQTPNKLDTSPMSMDLDQSPVTGVAAAAEQLTTGEVVIQNAFIAFAHTVRAPKKLKADWTAAPFHFPFKCNEKTMFQARTDGGLRLREGALPAALFEAKLISRYRSGSATTGDDRVNKHVDKIKMQEVTELACWIHNFPPRLKNSEDLFQ